ncbi:hypothetical protein ACIBTV_20730 [Micromonospora sp. NPDC049366]|uniref:hypothetical protein n=1 Tax=Micromonospora sp. NPDC049366 TaxID=3364271 RepID=UPI00379F8487
MKPRHRRAALPRHDPELDRLSAALAAAQEREVARSAAFGLLELAVEDAVAVGPAAPQVTREVRRLVETGETPWPADAFGVLIEIVNALGVWRRAREQVSGHGRTVYDPQVGGETAVGDELAGLDAPVREHLVHDLPEVRALAALLLARISSQPGSDLDLLRMVLAEESEDRTRACLAEAVLRLSLAHGIWAGADTRAAFAVSMLRDRSRVVQVRVARYFQPTEEATDPHRGGPEVVPLVADTLAAGPADRVRWPAEDL